MTKPKAQKPNPAVSSALREELLGRLMSLEYRAFLMLVVVLLRQSGYSRVQPADRVDSRGRTMEGGLDLRAYFETDLAKTLTIVQVKQYGDPVPRRFVDEIKNTMKRVGAQQGLIVTTSRFGAMARRAASSNAHRPVRLLDGDDLLDMLIDRGIGVRIETVQLLVIDDDFFASLQ